MVELHRNSTVGLNIKNESVEKLATEVAHMAHETKTEAIRRALLERRDRLRAHGKRPGRRTGLREYMERNVWPLIPAGERGRVLTHDEEDQILGYGPGGF